MLGASNGKSVYLNAFRDGIRPDPPLTVSDWANRYRFLPAEAAAEPGPYSTDRTPYIKEILDCLSRTSPIQEVVLMAGAQLGKSEGGNNWIGYVIDEGAGSMLVVQPTLELAKDYSKQRLQSMIDVTPRLSSRVREVKSRDAKNATLAKKFPGGWLFVGGANSAASLCSKPIGKLMLDEVDRFPRDVEGEGDPVELAKARTRTFRRRKIFQCSTPTIDGQSRIQSAYEASDKRRFHVPCPHCGEKQWLKFERLKWPKGEPRKATYQCEACDKEIEERHKTVMLARGEWIAENPEAAGLVAGFHLSSLCSPWQTWGEIAELFLKSKDDPTKLKSFVNTVLAEVWKEKTDAPEWERLYERRERYTIGKVPAGVVFLTGACDVQKDRLEVEIKGWGPGKESWSVDYRVIMGDTAKTAGPDSPWTKLDELVTEQFEHESGVMLPILLFAIDSGYNTQVVYNWSRKYPPNKVMVIKGVDNQPVILGQPSAVDVNLADGKRIARGLRVWPLGVGVLKSELYGLLRLPKPLDGERFPAGFCHHPEYADEYFRQLTAEALVPRKGRGNRGLVWEKTRERNEALDLHNYNRAAAAAIGVDRMKPEHWAKLAGRSGIFLSVETDTP